MDLYGYPRPRQPPERQPLALVLPALVQRAPGPRGVPRPRVSHSLGHGHPDRGLQGRQPRHSHTGPSGRPLSVKDHHGFRPSARVQGPGAPTSPQEHVQHHPDTQAVLAETILDSGGRWKSGRRRTSTQTRRSMMRGATRPPSGIGYCSPAGRAPRRPAGQLGTHHKLRPMKRDPEDSAALERDWLQQPRGRCPPLPPSPVTYATARSTPPHG